MKKGFEFSARPMRLLTFSLVASLIGIASAQAEIPAKQLANPYFVDGQATLLKRLSTPLNKDHAKNVIIFIADGAGPNVVTATRILEGQQRGLSGEENMLSYELFPYVAVTKTYNTNMQVPDSAGTSTAMQTGIKTKAGVISMGPDTLRGVCEAPQDQTIRTVAELAEAAGMSTGIVTTARVTHATPAAAYAHSPDRDWESSIPEDQQGKGCQDIASQLVNFEYGDGIDVVLGGGRREFIPATMADPEEEGKMGRRKDGQNLIQDWLSSGGKYVYDREGFEKLDPKSQQQILGLFNYSHMEYEHDRKQEHGSLEKADEPSLSEMTEFAIKKLQDNPKGFYLQVEGGRVDHALHAGNAYRALTDNIEFNNAVKKALELTDPKETLIIVTADHDHTLTLQGYPQRGNPILGLVRGVDSFGLPSPEYLLASDQLPYTTLSFANGPGAITGVRKALTDEDVQSPDYLQPALFPSSSETHGGGDVMTYAYGPASQLMRGTVEQSYLFHVIERALALRERLSKE